QRRGVEVPRGGPGLRVRPRRHRAGLRRERLTDVVLSGSPWLRCAAAGGSGVQAFACGRKFAHVVGAKVRRGPVVFLESRMWTVPGLVAISTQESPSLLLL